MQAYFVHIIFGIVLITALECDCCSRDYLPCGDGLCVYVANWCDTRIDCRNKNDENQCDINVCPDNWASCGNGQCYKEEFRCNIYSDCINGFDEWNCNEESISKAHETPNVPTTIDATKPKSTTVVITTVSTTAKITTNKEQQTAATNNEQQTTATNNDQKITTTDIQSTSKLQESSVMFSSRSSIEVQTVDLNTGTTIKVHTETATHDKAIDIMVYFVFPVIVLLVILFIAVVVFAAVRYIRKSVRILTENIDEDTYLNVKLKRDIEDPVNDQNLSLQTSVDQCFTVRVYDEIKDSEISSLKSRNDVSIHSGSLGSENSVNNLPVAPPLPFLSEDSRDMIGLNKETATEKKCQMSVLVDSSGYVLASNVERTPKLE